MSYHREIRVLQLEATDICQAQCPLCARETDINFDKNQKNHLSVATVRKLLDENFIKCLDKMFICGNYGDPAAGRYTVDLYNYFRGINPSITLGMNTNGGLRSEDWWISLARRMNLANDYVVFSIDGLEDTNHLYRVNVNWKKMMRNAQAFINAGGKAHWDMLIYEHNEHQVQSCISLAKEMGFTWFRAKVSKRPLRGILQFPKNWKKEINNNLKIDCHALKEQSLYIDAKGTISPCCWLGTRQNNTNVDFQKIQESWNSKFPEPVCLTSCKVTPTGTEFSDQWKIEISL